MIAWWWSWMLMAVGVTAMWLAGRRYWWAWLVGIFNELLWVGYAVATHQLGFIPFAIAYTWVYAKNAAEWKSA